MGKIPTVVSQVSARRGGTNAIVGSRGATADAFGGAASRALDAVGGGLENAARGVQVYQERKRAETVANTVAQGDFTRTELELRNQVGPDAEGYQDMTLEAYDVWVGEQADKIEDDEARQAYVDKMRGRRESVSSRAAQWEFGTRADNAKNQANTSLTALDNKIRLSPEQYDEFIDEGFAVIDTRTDVTAATREGMKTKWKQNAALSRFEGMLERATTVADVEALEADLSDTDERSWSDDMSAAGLERVLSLASSAKTSIATKADADARGAVGLLEGRASDPTSVIPKEEMEATAALVAKSQNPVTAARFNRVVRDQQIVQETRKLTPAQQRERIATRYNNPSLPPRLNAAITRASQMFGVSPAYLAATAKREYGMFLTGDPDRIDYGRGNAEGASSATGVFQFINDTWLGVLDDPRFQAATGLSTEGMSRQQKLDLRGDVELATMGGAFFTAQNDAQARRALGRNPTDQERYMSHFMGAGGASRLFRMMKANPNVIAADMFPKGAKANPTVYYDNGRPRTVQELYNELGRKHGAEAGSETYVEYGDRATREKVLEDTEKRVADDPMTLAFETGNATSSDIFEPGGMAARGAEAGSVADMYTIASEDMKPFTQDEAAELAKRLRDGTADDTLAMLTQMQTMGGDMARAAMRQIGETDPVNAYAGSLQLETGQGAVAAEVVRGQKRLDENPDIKSSIGATPTDLADAFTTATGGALFDAAPGQRQAIADAARAHYVETVVARGGAGQFDQELYAASVQAVMGATQGAPALDEVNGVQTVTPPGVSGAELETAFENMTVADWTTMSKQGQPPRYITGVIADPEDLADEAQLRAIGGGEYHVAVADGSKLITGELAPNGQLEPYVFVPEAEDVKRLNTAPVERPGEGVFDDVDSVESAVRREEASEDGLTHREYRALVQKFGAAAIDEWVQSQ